MDIIETNTEKRDAITEETVRDSVKPRSALGDQGPGNVDKIRDILFGSQMRDYELRFSRLEEGLRRESSDLRESTRKRLDALESYLKGELESLQARLKSEKDERCDTQGQISAELKNTATALAKKIAEAEDQNSQGHRELRRELLQLSKDLNDDIRAKTEDLAAVLDKRFQQLRSEKTDRAALASLLTEVAMRLTDEFRVPGAE